MDKWKVISDTAIRHMWIDSEGETNAVPPTYYEDNGTPVDPDTGDDMTYHNTEINVSALDHKLAVIADAFNESSMFYTPTSKEEATKWCELQGGAMTIGFMVGLNYAAEMVKQIMDGTHPGLTPRYDPEGEVPIPAHDATPQGEWSGSPDPADPDNTWIDDETGKKRNAD